ncbi:MAG: DedA family protein [Myxococcota bacterium]|nr:DedA family protein [Myxococcota bacterium]
MDTILRYGLVAVFLALILTPFGLPIPEDVSLLAAGILSATGHATLPQALVVGYVGVVGGDVISWTFGRRVGLQPTGFIARLVGRDDITRIERFYGRYGSWAIIIARQFPGMRMPAFFFAGASGVSLPRFLLLDGTAAVVTVGVFVMLGRIFADDLSAVVAFMEEFRFYAGVAVGLLVAGVVWRIVRRLARTRSDGPV